MNNQEDNINEETRMKEWWITLYGPLGYLFCKLENLTKEQMMDVITGHIEYKLEKLTQEERNARAYLEVTK